MNIEKSTINCETIYNEDKTHKFVLKRTWDKEKAKACVRMLNPGHADTVTQDTTTYLVMNNAALLDFGEVMLGRKTVPEMGTKGTAAWTQ